VNRQFRSLALLLDLVNNLKTTIDVQNVGIEYLASLLRAHELLEEGVELRRGLTASVPAQERSLSPSTGVVRQTPAQPLRE